MQFSLIKNGWWLPAGLLIAGAAFPLFGPSGFHTSVATIMLISIVGAYSVWLPWQLRLLSLGQAAFMGIGAYITAYLTTAQGWPFWTTVPLAGGAGLLAALLLGVVTLRLRGIYFAMASFVFLELFQSVLQEWDSVTNGPSGITAIPRPGDIHVGALAIELGNLTGVYYLTLITAVVGISAITAVMSSRVGLNIRGIAGSEKLALSVGVSVFRYRLLVLGASAAWVSLAGAFFAAHTRFVSPQNFVVLVNLDWLIYAVVGGLAGLSGPLLGAGVLEGLNQIKFTEIGVYRLLVYGGLLMITALYLKSGAAGTIALLRDYVTGEAHLDLPGWLRHGRVARWVSNLNGRARSEP